MQHEAAIALLRASPIASQAALIERRLVPSLRITTKRDPAAEKQICSRFGGTPLLPRGEAWPVWDSTAYHRAWIAYCERNIAERPSTRAAWVEHIARHEEAIRRNPTPLEFLGALRLADVAAHAGTLGLPATGVLLFFYDVATFPAAFYPQARGGWRVLLAAEESLDLVERPAVRDDDVFAATLSFESQFTVPRVIEDATRGTRLHVYADAAFGEFHATLLGGDPDGMVVHQLGGAPQEVQDGLFETCQFASNGYDCGSREGFERAIAAGLAAGASDWKLLLQIDSDEQGPGWMWGDLGRLYFCIRSTDLAEKRFDRVWCVQQCG
jgi:uncharacterized protein YwqG